MLFVFMYDFVVIALFNPPISYFFRLFAKCRIQRFFLKHQKEHEYHTINSEHSNINYLHIIAFGVFCFRNCYKKQPKYTLNLYQNYPHLSLQTKN